MNKLFISSMMVMALFRCNTNVEQVQKIHLPIHQDAEFVQDYSIKYYCSSNEEALKKAWRDRNGVIQVLSEKGLLRIHAGQFLYPGQLISDNTYRPLTDKNIRDLILVDGQFVYLDDQAVLSNTWAGKLFIKHGLPEATFFAGISKADFLVSDGQKLVHLSNQEIAWQGQLEDRVEEINGEQETGNYWLLDEKAIYKFNTKNQEIGKIATGEEFTSFAISGNKLIVGTNNGLLEYDKQSGKQIGERQIKLPWTEITAIEVINGNLWFGTTKGTFIARDDGKYNYYHGERWLPGNHVLHISKGDENTVLILTDKGLGKIVFKPMTLHDKAIYFEKQVRDRHIRHGFNASLADMEKGNIDSGRLSDSDNDGLWTSMYLGSQIFRYVVTRSPEALQNCKESLNAMERLYTVNPVPGFPSRSFERSGYIERLHDPERWQNSEEPEWDWKATTSSDEAIGHIFAFGVMAELIDDKSMKDKAISLIDTLMSHIVKNDLYLVDYDGEPTTWGKWHPDYVNARPEMVGDRKINSSNIIAMLQTAYHFTGKEKYKEKAFELINEHGYLENLMRPMSEIGPAPEGADDWSKMLSSGWNHSDDEMYFLGYWGLYRYAFNDSLKAMYKKAIIDHWEIERPEKEGLWNIMTALTGTDIFDLEEAIWYLQEHPMDLIDWEIMNSHRKDINFIEANFRNQTIGEVLPPDERPIQRHNANMFNLDRTRSNGTSEHSAGDIWLLPYWMGRYLGVISEPEQ